MGNQKQQRQGIAKRTLIAKKVLFAIFFSGEALQYKCQRKRVKRYWQLLQRYGIEAVENEILSETGPGQGFLLHDNIPARTSVILTFFFFAKRDDNYFITSSLFTTSSPCDLFLFPVLKSVLAWQRYRSRQTLGFAVYQYHTSIPKSASHGAFRKWIHRLKFSVQLW